MRRDGRDYKLPIYDILRLAQEIGACQNMAYLANI